jgi:hypothetical protein
MQLRSTLRSGCTLARLTINVSRVFGNVHLTRVAQFDLPLALGLYSPRKCRAMERRVCRAGGV